MEFLDKSIRETKVLAIQGRLDRSTVAQVRAWLESLTGSPPCYLVVNLKGVTYVDPSGLSALVSGLNRCRASGGELYLCCLPDRVRILFELTRLNLAFEIFPAEDAAVKAIESQKTRPASRQEVPHRSL
jgi:anti-sigma B factor antagonist